MPKLIFIFRAGVVCLLITANACSSTALASGRFVGPNNCSDSGAGSEAQPYCSLANGVARLQAGDTLTILNGTYNERLVVREKHGTAKARITIKAAPGAQVIIDGKPLDIADQGLIYINRSSYITLNGLTATRSSYYGIHVSASKSIVVEKCIVDSTEHGGIVVDQATSDIKVLYNEVARTDLCGKDCGVHEAITMSGATNFIVAGNYVHDGIKEGINAKDGSSSGQINGNTVASMGQVGIYLNHATNVKIFQNTIREVGTSGLQITVGDGATGAEVTTNNQIYQNVIIKNTYCGIQFWSGGQGDMGKNSIYNNVLYANGHYGIDVSDETGQVTGNIIRNNIIDGNKLGAIEGEAIGDNTISHNLFHKNGAASGTNVINADPQFVNAIGNDFHLRSTSPASDHGFDMGLPKKGAPDIGAYEYGLTAPTDTTTTTPDSPGGNNGPDTAGPNTNDTNGTDNNTSGDPSGDPDNTGTDSGRNLSGGCSIDSNNRVDAHFAWIGIGLFLLSAFVISVYRRRN